MTAIISDDVTSTLQYLGLLRYVNGTHVLFAPPDLVDELIRKYVRNMHTSRHVIITMSGRVQPQKEPLVDPSKLHWAPLVQDVKRDKWSFRSKVPYDETV